ncbi:glycosyltransferase family 4 protein [Marinicrinis sediminis]|uniref:Glycosyltransferase family 4 protein n=1 Tax=Marinicrinis sediminis TaxID=1652465 RepID=A0ABW5R861_9BACL
MGMFKLAFKPHYEALHFTNEFGHYLYGGMGTFMNHYFPHRSESTGFAFIYREEEYPDIESSLFPGQQDIVAFSYAESGRAGDLSFDIAVCHFYEFQFMTEPSFLQGRKLVYVIHSIPTPEPYYPENPFGEHDELRAKFENLCYAADSLVCVSHAEKQKLCAIYPDLESKAVVIHNGMNFKEISHSTHASETRELSEASQLGELREVREERTIFGFLGRLDYRKGLLEALKELKGLNFELHIACGGEDPEHLSAVLQYIEAANLQSQVRFMGWCSGTRRDAFLQSLDALIVPSLYEPFGYVILEAIDEGITLISSNGGGIQEIVGDYKYQFDPYQPGEMRDAICQFQRDEASMIQVELEKLQTQKVYFTAERMVRNYEQLFRTLLSSPASP